MKYLLIDAGNTRTKWATLQAGTLSEVQAIENQVFFTPGSQAYDRFNRALDGADLTMISNVAGDAWRANFNQLSVHAPSHWVYATAETLSLYNHYLQPTQLGADRWCNLIACWQSFRQSALVVSAGTALTIDAIQARADGKSADFLGGSIQPGLQLMWHSLQQGAAHLDHAMPEYTEYTLFARDSQQAMLQGCLNAMIFAIIQAYQQLAQQTLAPPLLVLTGGDAACLHGLLQDRLSAQGVIVDNLVLKGLACLAESASE